MAKLILPGQSPALLWDTFDFIGDSRCDAIVSAIGGSGRGTEANHWFPWVRALSNHKYKLGLTLGISGKTPDQYINTNLSQALASKSGWLVFDKPMVNALAAVPNAGVFPYTNTDGIVVTATNVAQVSVNAIIAAANKALALGKRVIITAEPGSTGLAAALVAQAFLGSDMLKAWCDVTPNATFVDPRPFIYNATSSATAIAFKAGYSSDGTHAYPAMAFAEAINVWKPLLDPVVLGSMGGPSNIAMVNSTYSRELFANPLFNTLTGGIRTTIGGTGNIPGGLTVTGPAGSTVNVTSVANANGLGNDVTFAITTTGAGTVQFLMAQPANGLWTLASYLTCGVDVDVTAGASNVAVPYLTNAIGTVVSGSNVGASTYDMYSNVASWVSPASAYSMRLRTPKTQPSALLPGSTAQWYTQMLLNVIFFAAGTITITLRLPTFKQGLVYANGAFSG
jgi:hypothetical protein